MIVRDLEIKLPSNGVMSAPTPMSAYYVSRPSSRDTLAKEEARLQLTPIVGTLDSKMTTLKANLTNTASGIPT